MSPDDPHSEIERELKAAFRAAAHAVHPSDQPFTDHAATSPPRASRGRWLAPAVVAAAVVAIGVPAVLIAGRFGAPTTAPAAAGSDVTVADGFVAVAGVRFPLPDGWTARASDTGPESVTVCVAALPTRDCDGVTVRVAIPDAAGNIAPLPDPLTYEGSRSDVAVAGVESSSPHDDLSGGSAIANGSTEGASVEASLPVATTYDPASSLCPILENTDPVGGRPAQHVLIGTCTPDSPQSSTWYVTDGSLTIWTPRGAAAAEATQIAAGIDFSHYRHEYGPQVAFATSGGVAPQTSSFSVPLGADATTSTVAGSAETGADGTSTTR